MQPLPGLTHTWFSLIRYRSPLHTESHLFSSPTGTEMFHFPASTPTQAMHSPAGNRPQRRLGFPIRTSSDQRLVGNSPRHNAASHVLHRPSMPRHPPYALEQNTLNNTHTHPTTTTKGDSRICAGNTQKRKKKTLPNQPQPHTRSQAIDWFMLASTLQFSHTTPTHPTHNHRLRPGLCGPQEHHTMHTQCTQTACCSRHPTACQRVCL